MSLKNVLFQQYAELGLNDQLKTLQNKYKPKKGRRFNENNITYEIGVPKIVDESIEFEVSSKIPQDELSNKEGMSQYFKAVNDLLQKSDNKPVSAKMENIIWDADKETEKNRDYVKVNYKVDIEELYSEKEISAQAEKLRKNSEKDTLPKIPAIASLQGRLLLLAIKENINKKGSDTISSFVEANKKVKTKLCKSRK